FTVTASANGCSATADVSVATVAPPNAGADGALSACSGGTALNLSEGLAGSPDAGGSWSGPSPVSGGLYDPQSMDPGVYTYTVAATAPCTGDVSAMVTVTESGHQAVVRINTDANGDQTTWEITDASYAVIASGGPYSGQDNMQIDETVCLGDLE